MSLSLLSALTFLLTLAGHCRALDIGTKVSIFALTAKDSAIVEGVVVDLEGVLFIIGYGSLTDQQNISTEARPTGSPVKGSPVKSATPTTVVHTTVSTQEPKVSEESPMGNYYLPKVSIFALTAKDGHVGPVFERCGCLGAALSGLLVREGRVAADEEASF